MAQWVAVLPPYLATHITVETKNWFHRVVSDLYIHTVVGTHSNHYHKFVGNFKKGCKRIIVQPVFVTASFTRFKRWKAIKMFTNGWMNKNLAHTYGTWFIFKKEENPNTCCNIGEFGDAMLSEISSYKKTSASSHLTWSCHIHRDKEWGIKTFS